MFSTVCANCSSAGLMMKPMPKNCNRNCLDHKEHVISRSHTPLDVKPKANCRGKKKMFSRAVAAGRKGTQKTADNLQGAPANKRSFNGLHHFALLCSHAWQDSPEAAFIGNFSPALPCKSLWVCISKVLLLLWGL